MRSKPPCSDEMFVVAWEKATTLEEAARIAGYVGPSAAQIASQRATRLRRRGVELRTFKSGAGGGRRDVEKLNWLAARTRGEEVA